MSIGANIRRLRTDKGLSQKELAAMVKVGQGQIANIESGRSFGSVGLLNRIADLFGVKLSDLTKEEPEYA